MLTFYISPRANRAIYLSATVSASREFYIINISRILINETRSRTTYNRRVVLGRSHVASVLENSFANFFAQVSTFVSFCPRVFPFLSCYSSPFALLVFPFRYLPSLNRAFFILRWFFSDKRFSFMSRIFSIGRSHTA